MSNPPHGISVDDYYQEPVDGSANNSWRGSPNSSPSFQQNNRNNHGSVFVRMKMLSPSVIGKEAAVNTISPPSVFLPDIRNPNSERRFSRASFTPSCYGSPYEPLHHRDSTETTEIRGGDYWVSPGTHTDNAFLTDAAWRNRFRENTAKIDWRHRIEEEADRDRRERRLVRVFVLHYYSCALQKP